MQKISTIDDLRELVRLERNRRGLTQAQVAGLAGYTQKWLSQFESGEVNPPAHMLLQLLTTLGIKLYYELPFQEHPATGDDEELSL